MKKIIRMAAMALAALACFGTATALADSINLSEVTANTNVVDGTTLTGTLGANVQITIADGATVTLDGVSINGVNDEDNCSWAGITCEGGATIILKGANTVKGFYEDYPGIHVPEGKTLTIKGDGSLDASSNGYGAGIGGGNSISCGNIVIEGGTIVATGGNLAAGIGGGGNVSCGDITIADTVTKVTATKGGMNAPRSIGSGAGGSCGTVTIGGTVYPDGITQSPYIYPSYTATLKDGTEDADNWTITPNEGVAEKDTVTVAYAGENKVKSVKAKKGTEEITVTPVEGKTNEWTFVMPAADVVVEVEYFAVATFEVDGETYAVTTNVVGEAVATPEEDPVKIGHSFAGWFTEATGGTQITDETLMGIADTTFYAQFRAPILTIENGVLTAVDFNGCTNVVLTIPDTVTTIGESAFYQCTGLASVTIPGSVKTISHAAFRDCSNLTSVTIEEGVTTIGERAFARCVNLASITIPGTVTEIGEAAFSDCRSLASLTIPGSVKTIGPQAFQNCTGLESVTVEEGVETIGRVAFDGCENLASVTIPDSVKEIGDDAFAGCSDALYEEGAGNLAGVKLVDGWAVGYDAGSISENLDLTGVRGIAGGAFAGCDFITSVIIPDGVATIPEYVFNGCDNLTGVTIPDSVTSIGEGAFGGCDNFASVTIPDSVTSIGKDAFEGCSEELFDTTTIPGVALVDGWAIGYTDALPENLDLTGARGIADNAFRDSTLESVTIPGTVARVPAGAFMSCTSLASVTLEEGVTAIDDSAFIECAALESVEIPDTVTAIGPQAFVTCAKLASVTVPGSVAEIGPAAFGMCSSLTNITIEAGVTNIGMMAFAMCSALESVEIPDTVTAIGAQAFLMSMNLASVTIPSSVMEIGQDAFAYTALATVKVSYGDGERVKELLAASGLDVSGLTFVEPYKLTFDPDGGEFAEGVETNRFLYAGEEFGELPEATRTGYTLAGWLDENYNEVAATNTMGEADATVYAQWTINQYTITFVVEGETYAAITNDYGAAVTAPEAPTKTGYTFAGWDPEIPETIPAEGLDITAKWTAKRATFEEQLSDDLKTVADKAEAIAEAFEGIDVITNLIAEINGVTVVDVAGTAFGQIMASAEEVDVNNAEITNALVQVLGMTDDEITALDHVLVVDPFAFLTGKKVALAYGEHGYIMGEASNPDTFEVAYTSSKDNKYAIVADASENEAARVFSFRKTADGIPVAIKLPQNISLTLEKNGESTLNAQLTLKGAAGKTYQVFRDDAYALDFSLAGTVKGRAIEYTASLDHTADRGYEFETALKVDGEGILGVKAKGDNTPYDEAELATYTGILEDAGGVWSALGKVLGFVNGQDLDSLEITIRDNIVIEGSVDDIGGMLAGIAQMAGEGEMTDEKIDAITAALNENVKYTVTQKSTGIEADGSFIAGDLFGVYLPLVALQFEGEDEATPITTRLTEDDWTNVARVLVVGVKTAGDISTIVEAVKDKVAETKQQLADAAAFDAYKTEQIAAVEAMAQAGDSEAATAIITNAVAAIKALEYDSTKTLDEQKAAVDKIVSNLAADLAAVRSVNVEVIIDAATQTGIEVTPGQIYTDKVIDTITEAAQSTATRHGLVVTGWVNVDGSTVTGATIANAGDKLTAVWDSVNPLVPETYGEGAVENAKAVTYDAYALDASGNAYGTVKVTVGRVGKNGLSSVKAVLKPYNDKSMTFMATEAKGGKATISADKSSAVVLASKAGDDMTLIIGAEGLEGVCTIAGVDYEINGSRNRVKTDKASYDFWMGARAAVFADETGAIVATFSFEMKPNGKVSVRGQFANGKTTNGTVQLMIADNGEEASVVINGSKKLPFSAVVWLGKNGAVTVESITTSVANGVACAAAGGAGGLSEGSYKFQTGNLEIPLTLKGKKFTSADAKATYKPKTGEFSGSYDERYTNAKGKTKKSKVKFGGVFVDGIGYGTTKSGATVTIVPAAE